MKESIELKKHLAADGSPVDAVYLLDATEVMNWLHEGVSHQVTTVFRLSPSGPLKPLITRCGESTSGRFDAESAQYLHLVPVPTSCVWCMGGRIRDSRPR